MLNHIATGSEIVSLEMNAIFFLLPFALLSLLSAQSLYRDGCILCEKMLPVCYPSCELDEVCMHTRQTCLECAKAYCRKRG